MGRLHLTNIETFHIFSIHQNIILFLVQSGIDILLDFDLDSVLVQYYNHILHLICNLCNLILSTVLNNSLNNQTEITIFLFCGIIDFYLILS